MKLSEKQAIMLLDIVQHSLYISGVIAYNVDDRTRLVNEIINQQSNKLVELDRNSTCEIDIEDTTNDKL